MVPQWLAIDVSRAQPESVRSMMRTNGQRRRIRRALFRSASATAPRWRRYRRAAAWPLIMSAAEHVQR